MIVLIGSQSPLIVSLQETLEALFLDIKMIDKSSQDLLEAIQHNHITAIIASVNENLDLSQSAFLTLLNSLAHERIVFMIDPRSTERRLALDNTSPLKAYTKLTPIANVSIEGILKTLTANQILKQETSKTQSKQVIFFTQEIASIHLAKDGGLAILSIDTSQFRAIEVEYGMEVYKQVQETFQALLTELWGVKGCFRNTDILCEMPDMPNIFYVLLQHSRSNVSIPLPGVLESIADRVSQTIQSFLHREIHQPEGKRRFPECIQSVPKLSVGFGSTLFNPALDAKDTVTRLLKRASKNAAVQLVRVKNRNREMMNAVIQSQDMLYPNYQAVFSLSGLTDGLINESQKSGSLLPLQDKLYGFESLIRVDGAVFKKTMPKNAYLIEAKYLNPQVLFSTAKWTNVSLELDQACIRQAVKHAQDLPGYIMINILPRNLYHHDLLKGLLQNQSHRIFLELSESENLDNLDLFQAVRTSPDLASLRIAVDDFGKAFTSFDRVLAIKPDLIKFDRGLISEIDKDSVKLSYLQGLIKACRQLKMKILAEGVETMGELRTLQKLDIDYVQGYLLHKPQTVEVIKQSLKAEKPQLQAAS